MYSAVLSFRYWHINVQIIYIYGINLRKITISMFFLPFILSLAYIICLWCVLQNNTISFLVLESQITRKIKFHFFYFLLHTYMCVYVYVCTVRSSTIIKINYMFAYKYTCMYVYVLYVSTFSCLVLVLCIWRINVYKRIFAHAYMYVRFINYYV